VDTYAQNRIEVIRPMIERLGGRLECAYLAFGENDVIGIMEMPDHVSAAAFSLAAAAGGALKARVGCQVNRVPCCSCHRGQPAPPSWGHHGRDHAGRAILSARPRVRRSVSREAGPWRGSPAA
jgi:hypothetical protein